MPNTVTAKDLPDLVAKAVAAALKRRNISDAELAHLLKGPITVGLLPPESISISGAALLKAGAAEANLLPHHDPRLIGFVANDLAHLKTELERK